VLIQRDPDQTPVVGGGCYGHARVKGYNDGDRVESYATRRALENCWLHFEMINDERYRAYLSDGL
jgi:hypothetical protein